MAQYKDSQTVNAPLDQGNRSAAPHSLDDPRVIRDVQQRRSGRTPRPGEVRPAGAADSASEDGRKAKTRQKNNT